MPEIKACLFDLDGVLVDTAKYHYIAWKETAVSLGIGFDEQDNELLKGVSRKESLEYILKKGHLQISPGRKEVLLDEKNSHYLEYVGKMTSEEVLPGVLDFLEEIKKAGIKIALGSASKNAPLILERCGISHYFDAIIDGRHCTHSKPHPEVFEKGLQATKTAAANAVVFEDAINGIAAAKYAGCFAIGIGEPDILKDADLVIPGFQNIHYQTLFSQLKRAN